MSRSCLACDAVVLDKAPDGPCVACMLGLGLTNPSEVVPQPAGHEEEAASIPAVGRYQLMEVMGAGGTGIVYRAWDPVLKREVALKMLQGRFVGEALHEQRRRFRTEAAVMARLDHPHLVTLHDYGEQDGTPWLVQEFMPRGNIADRLDHPVLPFTAAQWLRDLADAVAQVHGQGILHRDIKPSNVLMDDHGRVLLGDFGVARFISDSTSARTLPGHAVGSPGYMAPEQAMGRAADVGPPADIHGLGALLYHALTGFPPFTGATIESVLRQVIEDEPLPPRRLNPSIPRDLETICLKCLEKEPRRRYHNALALRDDLARFLAKKPVLARPLSASGRAVRWCQRRPLVASLMAALLVSLVGGLVGITATALRLDQANQGKGRSRDRYAFEMFDRWAREHETRKGLDAMAAILRESPGHIGTARRIWSSLDQRTLPMPITQLAVSNCLGGNFDSAGARVVVFTKDSRIVLCDAGDGRVLGEHPVDGKMVVHAVGFSPAGDHVWALDSRGSMHGWALPSWRPYQGKVPPDWNPPDPPLPPSITSTNHVAHSFTPDGRRVLLVYENQRVELRETVSGRVLIPSDSGFFCGGSDPFPRRAARPLLLLNTLSKMSFYDPESGARVGDPVDIGLVMETACWDPRGHRILAVPAEGSPVVLEAPRLTDRRPTVSYQSLLKALSYRSDGRFLVVDTLDQGVHLLESGTLREPMPSKTFLQTCRWAEWSGMHLLAVRPDGSAFFLDPVSGSSRPAFQAAADFLRLAVSPDGRRAATLSSHGTLELWDLSLSPPIAVATRTFEPPMSPIQERGQRFLFGFGFSPSGNRLAVTFNTGHADVWTIPAMDRVRLLGSSAASYGGSFHPFEDVFVMADSIGHVRQWSLRSVDAVEAQTVTSLPFVQRAVFDPTGRHLLIAAYYSRALALPWPFQPTDVPAMIAAEDAWQVIPSAAEPLMGFAKASGTVELLSLPDALVQARWQFKVTGQFNHMAFSPGAARLAVGSSGSDICEVSFPPADVPPPAWLLECAEVLGQRSTQMDPGGPNSPVQRTLALRRKLVSLKGDGFWERWGRYFARPVEP